LYPNPANNTYRGQKKETAANDKSFEASHECGRRINGRKNHAAATRVIGSSANATRPLIDSSLTLFIANAKVHLSYSTILAVRRGATGVSAL
jgi:hypothetical protein